jgi:hypothetical protein
VVISLAIPAIVQIEVTVKSLYQTQRPRNTLQEFEIRRDGSSPSIVSSG